MGVTFREGPGAGGMGKRGEAGVCGTRSCGPPVAQNPRPGPGAKVNLANSRESEHEGYMRGYNARLVVIRESSWRRLMPVTSARET